MMQDQRVALSREKLRDILEEMRQTLGEQVERLERLAKGPRLVTFVAYKQMRERYLEPRDLIDAMADRLTPIKDLMPPDFSTWLVQNKLRILAPYASMSHQFFSEPPETVTRALGAFEVLTTERANFARTLEYFDSMLLEAAVDDQTSEALEATRSQIEQILGMLDTLLRLCPKQLEEF